MTYPIAFAKESFQSPFLLTPGLLVAASEPVNAACGPTEGPRCKSSETFRRGFERRGPLAENANATWQSSRKAMRNFIVDRLYFFELNEDEVHEVQVSLSMMMIDLRSAIEERRRKRNRPRYGWPFSLTHEGSRDEYYRVGHIWRYTYMGWIVTFPTTYLTPLSFEVHN